MMARCLVMTAIALILTSALLPAQAAASPSQLASPTDTDAKIVCKSVLRSGSRLTERKCQTQGQWDAIAEAARRGAHEAFDRTGFYDCRAQSASMATMSGPPAGGAGC